MTAEERTGALLMTYGSPDSLDREDIRAYLARVRGTETGDQTVVVTRTGHEDDGHRGGLWSLLDGAEEVHA